MSELNGTINLKEIADLVCKKKQDLANGIYKCPICGARVNPETDFDDERSKKEFFISSLCQECQDKVFG
jgi:DNA-directed RNA polymerase subunit RPC12/RpoP